MPDAVEARRALTNRDDEALRLRRQSELLGIARSSLSYEPATETPTNLRRMRLLDEQYLRTPYDGSRRMAEWLQRHGDTVHRKRVQRLRRVMALAGVQPRWSLSRPAKGHRVFPYLLRGVTITAPNHVWCTAITYVPLRGGYVYLTAVMDWYSRYVRSWRLSNCLAGTCCIEALDAPLARAKPQIFSTRPTKGILRVRVRLAVFS